MSPQQWHQRAQTRTHTHIWRAWSSFQATTLAAPSAPVNLTLKRLIVLNVFWDKSYVPRSPDFASQTYTLRYCWQAMTVSKHCSRLKSSWRIRCRSILIVATDQTDSLMWLLLRLPLKLLFQFFMFVSIACTLMSMLALRFVKL